MKVKGEIYKLEFCRICKSKDLQLFLQLGPTPVPNGFLNPEDYDLAEKFYPLDVCFCKNCGLVQLAHVVSPEVMFKNYLYVPSTSTTMLAHFDSMARDSVKKSKIKKGDLVIDIGSNDGTLLKSFKKLSMGVLGIDPAENLTKKANQEGIRSICSLFTKELAESIVKKYGRAKIITATNVVAHVHDLHNFCKGIKVILEDDGLFIGEFPYLVDLIRKVEFDTIYQEHLSYFSLTPLKRLFEMNGIHLIDVKRTSIHGGSIRVFVSKKFQEPSESVKKLLKLEVKVRILKSETYLKFRKKVDKLRHDLVQLLWNLRLKNKRVVGYGASAKGNIILNYCRLGPETLDYIVDSIPYKQGKLTPGMHIPIYPESKLLEDQPDYTLVLAWNFANEIMKKQSLYKKRGGKFILAIPKVKVV